MYTDPIADLLTRLRNGSKASLSFVDIPHSREKLGIVEVLKDSGFVSDFKVLDSKESCCQKTLRVIFRYRNGASALVSIVRVSKPGLRVYSGYSGLKDVLNGMGISILSTSKGIMADKVAKKLRVGGEVLCSVY